MRNGKIEEMVVDIQPMDDEEPESAFDGPPPISIPILALLI